MENKKEMSPKHKKREEYLKNQIINTQIKKYFVEAQFLELLKENEKLLERNRLL
jgi:hypothetical protein